MVLAQTGLCCVQVQYRFGELSHEKLKQEGVKVKFRKISGMGHTAVPEELVQLVQFVQEVLPQSQ